MIHDETRQCKAKQHGLPDFMMIRHGLLTKLCVNRWLWVANPHAAAERGWDSNENLPATPDDLRRRNIELYTG